MPPKHAPATDAVEQPRLSEESFRLLIESVKDYAIFMLDPTGVVMTWNAGAQRLKGYSADEIIGRHFSVFYRPEDMEKPQRELETALAEGRSEDEGWRVRKDGSLFWANVLITAIYDHAGTLRGFAKVTRDLTDRRRLEQERLKLAHANEAIRLRDEFLSIAAHELRTPINALVLQLAGLELALHRDPVQRRGPVEPIARAARQARRLNQLIERLLDVSRLASGQLALNREPMDLMALLRDLIADFSYEARAVGCAVSLTGPEKVVGDWDPLRIEQVITNLLSNAVKYGAESPIEVIVTMSGEAASVAVSDHGVGIAPEDQTKIFERFERGAAAYDRGGLGIGLYVARSLVEAHGGTMEVESEASRGSTFTFTLPLESREP